MSPIDVANPDAPEAGTHDRDLGPLAWVLDEIRQSLDGSVKALRRFVHDAEIARDSDIAALEIGPLRIARQQLHQAGGALEMVGMSSPALLLHAMEAAVQKFVQQPELATDESAGAIERASFALNEYLEIVLAGKTVSAVTLFPQYRDVQALNGAERVHPADLRPDERRFREPEVELTLSPIDYGESVRDTLDEAVLRIVKDSDFDAAHELRDMSLGLAAAQSDKQARAFWKVSAAFFDAFSRGMFVVDVYAKRVVSRILIQYVALARGDADISHRLVQELLFFCTQARIPVGEAAPLLTAVRDAFSLERFEPVDYEARRFGRFDPAVLAKARKRIAAAAEAWSALAGGDRNKLKPAADQFGLVFDSLRKLNNHSDSLVQALTRTLDQTARSGEPPSAPLAMEVATAVLYLQSALEESDTEQEQMALRAGELAQRLDEVRSGKEPAPLESWMEELYRRVSDQQTMGSVVQELHASLGEAERAMDQFFRNPDDTTPLAQVPERLSQMRGVLSVLGLDQASHAVLRMRESIEKLFQDDPCEPDARKALFERLGNSLGALGFMFDMLSYQRTLARKLFVYDEDAGELRLIAGRVGARATDAPVAERRDSLPTATDEKVPAPVVTPDSIHLDGATEGNAPATTPDATAAAQIHVREPEVDAELREIFLEEASEVVATGLVTTQALAVDASNLSEQTTLRRAFHTLKGSSRMVGLNAFGEAAWSMEQLLNAWLAEQKPIERALLETSEQSLQGFGRWVSAIAAGDDSAWSAIAFTRVADAMRVEGNILAFEFPDETKGVVSSEADSDAAATAEVVPMPAEPDDAAQHDVEHGNAQAAVPAPDPEVEQSDEHTEPADFSETAPLKLEDFFQEYTDKPESKSLSPEPLSEGSEIDFSEFEAAQGVDAGKADSETAVDRDRISALAELSADLDSLAHVVSSDQSAAGATYEATELAGIFDATELAGIYEATELASIEPHAPQERDESNEPQEPEVLAGIEPMDAADAVTEIASLDGVEPPAAESEADAKAEFTDEDNIKDIGDLRIGLPLYNVYLNEADEWSRRLATALQEWSLELQEPLPDTAVALAHSLAGSSATVGFSALSQISRLLEHTLAHAQLQASGDAAQARVFINAAEDIRRLLHQFAAGFLKTPDTAVEEALLEILETEVNTTLSPAMDEVDVETARVDIESPAAQAPSEDQDQPTERQPLRGDVAPALSVVRADSERAANDAAGAEKSRSQAIDEDIDAVDVIDPDLFPIFEEEAAELLPQLGGALRQWTARPDNASSRNEVLRALHTLKGSSRLAGAMRLGEMAHRMESAIEQLDMDALTAGKIEPLLGNLDSLEANFQALRAHDAAGHDAQSATDLPQLAAQANETTRLAHRQATVLERPFDLARPLPDASASNQSVRVRALLLDRMVNQAGEVMITRSRMESRLTQLRTSLGELTANLARLREQLRDIEVQSESQMQSRLALTKESTAGFDPLEFDRFTRVQELTRMMAESVNDVATVQRNLQRVVEGTEDDLVAQGRQARELQRDLLRTRMMEFEGAAERLYAVVRQSSKEAGKQIKLDISGGKIEMDRGVIDRMVPAFEHLLRNCVAHGIELPEQRVAAGKDATGTISVSLRQEGNDVSVEFRDDGAGLNLERIRARAIEQKLIEPDAVVSNDEAAALIFAPGFTTAIEVTEMSGRGIGMDVVRSELRALGGRIETTTETGVGSAFRMVLPLTTAVTQVVMLRAGAFSFGVPSMVVEQVQSVSAENVANAYANGQLEVAGEQVPFFWAGALLQASPRSHETVGKKRFVVILRSAAQRVAIHVDDVLGNQEVVVKNLGPQLSRLPGLAGMSVLASGAVVLIYNPVALAAVYGDDVKQAISRSLEEAASTGGSTSAAPGFAAVGQLPLVLVVDDSITVRRVTQRLLLREGYRVVLAADGLQALERLQEERPAVVLSDIEMPRMDGFDLARNIRADAELSALPIVMITSRIAQKHRDMATQLGVDHYLGKPYSDEELLGLVRHYVEAAANHEVTP